MSTPLPELAAAQGRLAALSPPVVIDLEAFAAYLTELGVSDIDGLCSSGAVEDLMLAFACVHKDRAALAAFYARYEARLRAVIARTCGDPDEANDVFHELVIKLTLRQGSAPPGLMRYEGRGRLLTWLRVVAARAAIDHARKGARVRMTQSLVSAIDDLGLEASVLERYRKTFKLAVAQAMAELDERQRTLLRYHLAGLGVAEIAETLGHHRVTISKWLRSLREQLRTSTLRALDELNANEARLVSLDEFLPHLSASFDRLLAVG
jgi:RNA polymerase sigma-70 factor (ECF subfamily)